MPRILDITTKDGTVWVSLEGFDEEEGSVSLWSDEEKEAAFARIRAEALEEAAILCDRSGFGSDGPVLAISIRALKDKPANQTEADKLREKADAIERGENV